jgi:hypothetical protein
MVQSQGMPIDKASLVNYTGVHCSNVQCTNNYVDGNYQMTRNLQTMSKKHQVSVIHNMACLTASTLDIAILELKSGDPELCLDTLNTLKHILREFTDIPQPVACETST